MSSQWAGDLESSDVSLGRLGGGYQGDGGQAQGREARISLCALP